MAEKPSGSGLVVSSNELIHAKYHFTLWQKRVFMYFVALIEKEAFEFGLQKAFVADLVKFFEAEQNGTVTGIIENVPRQLYEMSIQVPYRDEQGHDRFGEVRLVTKYTKPQDKRPGNAYIELKFNEDLKPHLLDLKKHFSKYELQYIVHLQSAHAIRIYEILKSHQYQKQIDLDVDYLKVILEVDSKYKLYGDFKRKIIDKAQQDLAEHCDIGFTYKEIKSGKKVVTLRFSIFENRPGSRAVAAAPKSSRGGAAAAKKLVENPPPAANSAENDAVFLELQATVVGEWGVSPTRFWDLVHQFPAEQLRRAFRVSKRKIESGGVVSKAGFFIEAVQKNYADEQEQAAQKKARQQTEKLAAAAQVEAMREKLANMLDNLRGEINQIIRQQVEADSSIRERAIAAVRATKNPVLKIELEQSGGGATEQDFRENPKLREAVVWEIVRQNESQFEKLGDHFEPQIRPLLEWAAPGTLRPELKKILNLH